MCVCVCVSLSLSVSVCLTTAKNGRIFFDDMSMKTNNNLTFRFKFRIPGSDATLTTEFHFPPSIRSNAGTKNVMMVSRYK